MFISQEEKRLFREIDALTKNYELGKISENEYQSLLKYYQDELENIKTANRVRRLQGRGAIGGSEQIEMDDEPVHSSPRRRPIPDDDYDIAPIIPDVQKKETSFIKSKLGIVLIVTLLIVFIVGITAGILALTNSNQAADEDTTVVVSESAFPDEITATKITTNTTGTTTTKTDSSTSKTKKTNTKTDTTDTKTDTQPETSATALMIRYTG